MCGLGTFLERMDSLLEMKDFPKRDRQIQESDARYCSPNPSRSDHCLELIKTGFARRIQKKIIIAPFAQAKGPLGNPWQ